MTTKKLDGYLTKAVESVMRPASGFLKHPFIVPGGAYADELWDWDSYWMTKGFLSFFGPDRPEERAKFFTHAQGAWINMMESQAENGAIPILSKADNRDVFNCTSDGGVEFNQAKPVLGMYAEELCRAAGSDEWIRPYFSGLVRFYDRWFGRYGTSCGLLVWGSDVAIGVDNDPTTMGRPEFSSANLLLNCLCYADLQAAAAIAGRLGRPDDEASLKARASALGEAIRRECWDPVDGFYYTVDVQCGDHRDKYIPKHIPRGMDMSWRTMPLKIKLFTGFLPMWCGLASKEEAARLVEEHLKNPREFAAPWSIPALAMNERMYAPGVNSGNPSNWLGTAWVLSDYLIYEGLKRYGYEEEARQLAGRTHALLEKDLQETGTMHEYYNPETGAPNFNGNFLSWNVLAAAMQP